MTNLKRHLDLAGADNIRDLGGYTTAAGRQTRWQILLRADSLHQLTPNDQRQLLDLGLRTVIDLRRNRELAATPDVFAASTALRYLHIDMIGTPDPEGYPPPGEGAPMVGGSYCVLLDRRREAIRQVLATLAAPGTLPALFHCAGGADRTGIIAALVLALAGVPQEVIVEDYALTARYLTAAYCREQERAGKDMSGYTWKDYQRENCPPQAMEMALQHLRACYGGVREYVDAIGVRAKEVDHLRASMLD